MVILSNKTEKIAVRKIEEVVDSIPTLNAFIDSNDKFPVWDGSILVYSSENTNNENLKGKIPIQVKGTTVKEFSGDTKKHIIRTSDLESYLMDGGVIFFVVEIIKPGKTKIYYSSLIPIELDDLLSNKKENQKNITSKLKFLDESNLLSLESICSEFLLHREHQFSTIKHRIAIGEMENLEQLKFTVFAPRKDFYKHIFNNEVILYGRRRNDSIDLPITKIQTVSIMHCINLSVSIKSKAYFDKCNIEKSKDGDIFILGENIQFNLQKNTLKYKIEGNLSSRLKDLLFLKDLIIARKFSIDKYEITEINVVNDAKKYINNYYEFLISIQSLLRLLNIKEDLKMDCLTEGDWNRLQKLVDIILFNKKAKPQSGLESDNPKIGKMFFKIANINILTLFKIEEDGMIKIFDYFDVIKALKPKTIFKNEETEWEGCIYTELLSTDIVKANNLNLNKIKVHIKEVSICEEYANQINVLILELIKAFDINNELIDCLDTALNLCEWLIYSDTNSIIYEINKLQIIKRIRQLNEEEKEKLIKIREKLKEEYMMLCGINILLDNKADFEYCFLKMTKEQQLGFKDFPIYRLK